MKKTAFILLIVTFLFTSCKDKNMFEDYNLSERDWLNRIIKQINKNDLEEADSSYSSFYSEHINSPLLGSAMLLLSNAHKNEGEYLLANYYIDEYIKLFGSKENYAFLDYLKIKNNYYSLALPKRNQNLLQETIKLTQVYIVKYPDSEYVFLVNTIKNRLLLSEYLLDKDILKLYRKMGYKESVSIYEEKLKDSSFNDVKIIYPKLPWYRKILE